MPVALIQRHEFVQHAVLGPARHRNQLAYADAAGQLVHRRQAPVGVPIEYFVLVRGARAEAAQLDARRERLLPVALARLGAADAVLIGEDVHALDNPRSQHLLVFLR
ncbi:hypothetical protein D3C83_51090 [compost metagenome]